MIEEVTQSKCWKLDQTEILQEDAINHWKNVYHIDFDEKNICEYSFSKKTSDKKSPSYLRIICFPGYYQLFIHTHQVIFSIDMLLEKNDLIKKLTKEI